MKPGSSREVAVVFPISEASSRVVCSVWSLVARLGMISTSFITGTGFMKCIPMTCSGLCVKLPILVMEMEEVLEARMACLGAFWSSSLKMIFFNSVLSFTASMTKSDSPTSNEVEPLTRLITALLSSSVILCLATFFANTFSINPSCFVSCSWFLSMTVTSYPAVAATCAIPIPICPPPITATLRILAKEENLRAAKRRELIFDYSQTLPIG
eukprot:Lithocolla_globosa_v1_NODE_2421_length_2013_cov_11.888151.p2 type:complete len:212 gc:universal NODE_2421_length_2013_cov_11.888151:1037-402(-)